MYYHDHSQLNGFQVVFQLGLGFFPSVRLKCDLERRGSIDLDHTCIISSNVSMFPNDRLYKGLNDISIIQLCQINDENDG